MTATAPPTSTVAAIGLLHHASDIPAAEWNGLARRGFHLHEWFLAAERCGWRPRHVALHQAGRIRSIVPAYLTEWSSPHDLHDRWLGPLGELARKSGVNLRPIISVQAPFALVSEALGDEVASTEHLHRVFEILESSALEDGAKAVVWPGVDSGSGALLQVARERGYVGLYGGSTARLPITWDSFEHYLAARSKSVRRTIKKDLEGLRSAGITSEMVSEFRSSLPAMNTLFHQAFRRRNGKDAAVHPEFFQRLSAAASTGVRAQLTWSGTQLVGTSINLMTPRLLEGTLSAFSSEHCRGPAYYNDLCYEPIRVACREGIAAIDLGATALYAKVLRGAQLRRRVVLLKGTTPTRHRLLSALGSLVARRTEWKERRALGALWHNDTGDART